MPKRLTTFASEDHLVQFIGLPLKELKALTSLVVFSLGDDGRPEELGRASSIDEAIHVLIETLFGEMPDYDPAVLEDMEPLEGEPPIVRALNYELSDAMLMYRTHDAEALVYLRGLDLPLVVAWEAAAPAQDAAVGIFHAHP